MPSCGTVGRKHVRCSETGFVSTKHQWLAALAKQALLGACVGNGCMLGSRFGGRHRVQRVRDLTSRMPELGKSGSVGAVRSNPHGDPAIVGACQKLTARVRPGSVLLQRSWGSPLPDCAASLRLTDPSIAYPEDKVFRVVAIEAERPGHPHQATFECGRVA